jgi:DNA-binding NarL/FixJ family response regulator
MPGAAHAGPTRIVLAHDNRLLAEALQVLLGPDPRFELVGLAFEGPEAVSLAAVLEPDFVLLDEAISKLDVIETTRRICATEPSPRVVILTDSKPQFDLGEAHRAGAAAFLPKPRSATSLLNTLELATILAPLAALGNGAGVGGGAPN